MSACETCSSGGLFRACSSGELDVVKLLIEKRADHSYVSTDEQKIKPFLYLLDEKHVDVNEYYGGCSALWVACQEGHVDVANLLLDKGTNANMG